MSALPATPFERPDVPARFARLREDHWPAMAALASREIRGTWRSGVAFAERVPEREASAPTGPVQAMAIDALSSGGKRLRAVLPLLVAEALDVAPERLLALGAACEVLHNGTLVHDDLQDGDTTRRGAPTVWHQHGMAHAINVGDAMLFVSALLLRHLDVPPQVRDALMQQLVRDTLAVIDGQGLELELRLQARPTLASYLAMVEGKTSGLFSLPMAGAARVCQADNTVVGALAEAARHLGVLFQVQDDLLDLYGDKGRGTLGNDLREGKRSFLVVHTLTHAPPTACAWLRSVLDGPGEAVSDEVVGHAITLFERTGSVGCALDEVNRRRAQACAAVDDPRLADLVGGLADLAIAPIASLVRRTFPRAGTSLGRTA